MTNRPYRGYYYQGCDAESDAITHLHCPTCDEEVHMQDVVAEELHNYPWVAYQCPECGRELED